MLYQLSRGAIAHRLVEGISSEVIMYEVDSMKKRFIDYNYLMSLEETDFIKKCYLELFSRNVDELGYQVNLQRLKNGFPKISLLYELATSKEAKQNDIDTTAIMGARNQYYFALVIQKIKNTPFIFIIPILESLKKVYKKVKK